MHNPEASRTEETAGITTKGTGIDNRKRIIFELKKKYRQKMEKKLSRTSRIIQPKEKNFRHPHRH